MKNELEKINKKTELKALLPRNCSTSLIEKAQELKQIYKNIKQFECPDVIAFLGHKTIGIEHFEYDSSINKRRKGSEYRIKEQDLNNRVESKINEYKIHNSYASKIKLNSSLCNIKKNFVSIFYNHINKIDAYISNIRKTFNCSSDNIGIWFYAEDITPLGNSVILKDNTNLVPYLPLFDEFISVLRNNTKVEGIIFGLDFLDISIAIINDEEVLDALVESEIYNISEEQFISSKNINTLDFFD